MFFITTITNLEKFVTRTPGWFQHREDAEKALINNDYDLWETIYNYGVIEYIGEGLYSCDDETLCWYKFNIETLKYDPIDTPKGFEDIRGIGVG